MELPQSLRNRLYALACCAAMMLVYGLAILGGTGLMWVALDWAGLG
jgi:hypothetical protein